MKYIILIHSNEHSLKLWETLTEQQRMDFGRGHLKLTEEMAEAGELIVSEGLADPALQPDSADHDRRQAARTPPELAARTPPERAARTPPATAPGGPARAIAPRPRSLPPLPILRNPGHLGATTPQDHGHPDHRQPILRNPGRRDIVALNKGSLRHPIFGRSYKYRTGNRAGSIRRNGWAVTKITPGFHDRGVADAMDLAAEQLIQVVEDFAERLAGK